MDAISLDNGNSNDKITYRRIRKAIGIIGIGLPILLVFLPILPFIKTNIQDTISNYYYSNLREIFTGSLCAVGLFLIRYEGHHNPVFWKNDSLLTNITGITAFGIALFPTNPDDCYQKIYTLFPYNYTFLGWLHYGFATIFFVLLAIISIHIFTIGQERNNDIPVSVLNENNIYKTCGILILVCIALVPVFSIFHLFKYSTLLFEALALFAFGISWLIKGRALGDKGAIGEKLYREHH